MTMRSGDPGRRSFVAFGACALLLLAGCGGKPSAANTELRKQLQSAQSELAQLRLQRDADHAKIRALEGQGPTTVPSLPNERLQSLFTTHGIRLGRLTGFADVDPQREGVDGIKVYLTPTDGTLDDLKAAGAINVEAFDLNSGGKQVGKWTFGAAEAKKLWNGTGLLYEYVVPCPFDSDVPQASELTLKVTFTDELTGRSFSQQQVIKRR
jgi:hypothetical protein